MNYRNEISERLSAWRRGVLLAILAGTFALLGTSCHEGREGDRCNPIQAANLEDECNDGLTCQTPSTCVESYCCPKDPSTSSNPFCNGMMCPAPADAGSP